MESVAEKTREGNEGPILEVRDLKTYFRTSEGIARAVDGISFRIRAGESYALVGESGCGKSQGELCIWHHLCRS